MAIFSFKVKASNNDVFVVFETKNDNSVSINITDLDGDELQYGNYAVIDSIDELISSLEILKSSSCKMACARCNRSKGAKYIWEVCHQVV